MNNSTTLDPIKLRQRLPITFETIARFPQPWLSCHRAALNRAAHCLQMALLGYDQIEQLELVLKVCDAAINDCYADYGSIYCVIEEIETLLDELRESQ